MRSRALLSAISVSILSMPTVTGIFHTTPNRAHQRALGQVELTDYRQTPPPTGAPRMPDASVGSAPWAYAPYNQKRFWVVSGDHGPVLASSHGLVPMVSILTPQPPPPPVAVATAPKAASGPAPVTAAASSIVTSSYTIPANLAPIFACIRYYESRDNYAESANPGYRGAYQFAWSTWQELGQTGDPAAAPPWLQDEMAVKLYRMDGWTPWQTAPLCGV